MASGYRCFSTLFLFMLVIALPAAQTIPASALTTGTLSTDTTTVSSGTSLTNTTTFTNVTDTGGTIMAANPTGVPLPNETIPVSASSSVAGLEAYGNGTIVTSVNGVTMSFFFDPKGPTGQTTTTSAASTATVFLTVNAIDLSGNPVTGMYIELQNLSGKDIATGYSPATFSVTPGTQYVVYANSYKQVVFNHWDDGTTNPGRTFTISQSATFTAYYSTGTSTATVPQPPSGLAAKAGDSQVSLSWVAPSNNGGSAITSYNIYRGTATGAEGSAPVGSVSGSTLGFTDTGLANGQAYYYEVAAVNSVGSSAKSNEAGATPQGVPQPPTGLAATASSSSQINLSWNAPANNGGSQVTGYVVERSADSGSTWSTIASNTGTPSTTYSDTGLQSSTTYTYRVSAINSVGTSQPSNTASATTQGGGIIQQITGGSASAPQPPTGLTATASSSSQINLGWTAPSNDGGSPVTGYDIERSADSGSTWSTIASNTGTPSTTYSDTGLQSSTTYTYRVSAINSVGTSQPSNTASATTQGIPSHLAKVQSGLVAADSLTNETESQQQLQSSPGYWSYDGSAVPEHAPYSFDRDTSGFHVSVQAPKDGTWAGFFGESPNHSADLWSTLVTNPLRALPSTSNQYYENGIYVQTSNGLINYVTCSTLTNNQATIWVVVSTTGNTNDATSFDVLWEDSSANQPLTRDCTLITNGNNYLKVYLDGNLVYTNNNLKLQMPPPFNMYLEPETSYAGQMLTGTFTNYYVTLNEYAQVNNLPPNASRVDLDDPSGNILTSSQISAGSASLDVGKYGAPIQGTIKIYDASNNLLSASPESVYGGDIYSYS